ncbi:MAG: hypothetical protein KKB45_08520 [Gammaproteobacteria bacterium]|nr:hypothetical protein [Gammaproteobacteria bacterium]
MVEPASAAVEPLPTAAVNNSGNGHDTDTAHTEDRISTKPLSSNSSLIDAVMALWLGLRQRMFLQLQLLTLETQRAAQSLVNLLILACLAAALVISCWIGVLVVGILALTSIGLSMLAAVSCMLLLNLFALLFCLKLIRTQSCYLCFPATIASLMPEQPAQTTTANNDVA